MYNSNNDLIYSGNPFIYNTDSTEEITVIYNDYDSCIDTTTFVINVSLLLHLKFLVKVRYYCVIYQDTIINGY